MKVSEFARQNSVSKMTVYRMVKNGQLPFKRLPTGTIVILDDVHSKPDKTVVYARVSPSQSREDLEAQADRLVQFCNAKGWCVAQIVKERASGLNDNRSKLLKLLKDTSVTRIVVEHKDRLTRFGFNYISLLPIEIVVTNNASTDKEDLIQDFVTLVNSFCAQLYGRKRSKQKTEELIRKLQEI